MRKKKTFTYKNITFNQELIYIDITPSIAYGWNGAKSIYIGWLFWNIIIDLK